LRICPTTSRISTRTLAEALAHLELEYAIHLLNPPEQVLLELAITADEATPPARLSFG